MSYEPKAGDRIRAEVTIRSYAPDSITYEIDASTIELIEQAKSPGRRAYERWRNHDRQAPGMRLEWKDLGDARRQMWDDIADAARE